MNRMAILVYLLVGAVLGGVWMALPDPLAFQPADSEYLRQMQSRGREVAAGAGFPGWKPWESTVLLTKGKVNYLVSPDLTVKRLDPPEIPMLAAGAGRIKGQALVIMPSKPALEKAVGGLVGEMDLMQGSSGEAALIKGLLRTGQAQELTDDQYLSVFVHEAFHLYQLGVLEPWADRLTTSQGDLWRQIYTDAENNRLQNEEGAALLAAIRAPDEAGALREARRFLAVRRQRQAYWNQNPVLEWEAFYEWSEGLARYVQIKATPGEALVDEIGEPVSPEFARERVYRLGAGQALVLDRLAPGWKERAATGTDLTSLLSAALR